MLENLSQFNKNFFITSDNLLNLTNQLINFSIEKKAIYRSVRAGKSKTLLDFYNEISAALQFPFYFGENNHALNDCLSDLNWLEDKALVLLISNSDLFLSQEGEDVFESILGIFKNSQIYWQNPTNGNELGISARPFNIIFHCNSEKYENLKERFEKIRVSLRNL